MYSLLNQINDFHHLFFLTLSLFFSIFLYKKLFNTKSSTKLNLPPSPPRLPLIGHLHKLGKLPHRSLQSISSKYGDIMLLYLGNKPTLVVSSSKYAEEIMKTHDVLFANRPLLRFNNRIFFESNDVLFNTYCPKWRHLKSICVLQLLNKRKVNSFRSTREEEIALMIEKIKSYNGAIFNLSETIITLTNDLICRSALGIKYSDYSKSGANIQELFKELVEVVGAFSIGDYIPMLGWIDKLTGLEGRVEYVRKRLHDFIEEVVRMREGRLNVDQGYVDEKDQGENVKDFVDVLLEIQREHPDELARDDIKAVLLDMFAAGTETSSTTLEWAMVELLRHPTIMETLREEITNNVGYNGRVTEDDLENMKYLDAVIKETLRLHLPAPLLLFRECSEDIRIDNYDILEKTQVIINAGAIQRDPRYWNDPELFCPERFIKNTLSIIDYKGQNFKYIPFGAGRRSCPAVSYAIVNTKLILASLIHEFDYALPNGRDGLTLDIKEASGITIRPLNPLKVIAFPKTV